MGDCCMWDALSGLGPSCWSNCLSFPPGLGYFLHLFKNRTEEIAQRVTDGPHGPPRSVAVCMVYYLDEKPGGSWAEHVLRLLGLVFSFRRACMYVWDILCLVYAGYTRYNRNPRHLQSVMKRVFELATSKINLPGTTVVAIPLFEALDGSLVKYLHDHLNTIRSFHTYVHTYIHTYIRTLCKYLFKITRQ